MLFPAICLPHQEWASYRMCPSPIPTYPKLRGCKSATTDWAHHVGSFSSLTTIVVMNLFNVVVCTVISLHVYCVYKRQRHIIDIRSPHVIALLLQFLLVFCGIIFYLFGRGGQVSSSITNPNTWLLIDWLLDLMKITISSDCYGCWPFKSSTLYDSNTNQIN